MAKAKSFKTHVGLAEKTRSAMVELLNQQLADLSDLYSQTKQAHWNVKGMNFIALHKLFDELAEALEDYTDDLAERVTELGGMAMGTARMAAANSRLPEFPMTALDGESVVTALVERYGAAANYVRDDIDTADKAGDADTADLFTEISRGMDKHLWFLEAHIQG
ncbi:MAG: DNA starvation/stationary phase protection protein Dps [Anaerolineae bacterium]